MDQQAVTKKELAYRLPKRKIARVALRCLTPEEGSIDWRIQKVAYLQVKGQQHRPDCYTFDYCQDYSLELHMQVYYKMVVADYLVGSARVGGWRHTARVVSAVDTVTANLIEIDFAHCHNLVPEVAILGVPCLAVADMVVVLVARHHSQVHWVPEVHRR